MQNKKLLIIGYVWVEPNSSAAGKRMLQLIYSFLEAKYDIVFASPAIKSSNAFSLTSIGVKEVNIELNSSSFDAFISELQPSIVLFDRFMMEEQFGWRVAENCPKAIRILDTEDLHCLRKTREICYKKNYTFSIVELLKQESTKREIAAILRCDLSLIISSFEMDLLINTFKVDAILLCNLPFLFDEITSLQQKKWNTFEQREHFIFIGNFFHKPNVDAVLTLKKEIWPQIVKMLPKAEIHIYGAYANQQIKELHNAKEGFLIKGFAEDAEAVVSKAKVVLAPLNFGAGIKGKLTEAMLCGTPSVTTTIGKEGMCGNFPWNGFVENNYNNFAVCATELYTNKSLFKNSQLNGINIINTFYNKQKNTALFFEKIHTIKNNLANHRIYNFMGSIIMQQSMQATKYMSKWIEAKNS